ncbi:MAG TPA: gliding motility-associated C-terminal domain-containing protein, partial [Chitinophagaceae bacterium]|nr:gliding motility-associated C-terminal domain-containing protein [Chitinophagaceae bacterium]
ITPNYGTQGIPAITNQPPQGSTFNCWKDQSDRFYIGFGTFGNASVWRYDAATNMWVWLNGDPAPTVNHGRRFLSMCTASTDRHPGIRVEGRGGMHRTDCSEDLLWFCGGQDNGYYNDLWVYKPSNNTWTWIAGDSTGGNYGQYGVKGVPAATNQLADRTGHAMWVDQYQQVWVFGGIVRGGTSRGNDLWRFTPDMNCLGVVVDTFQLYPPADTLLCYGEQSTMFAHAQFSLNVSPMTGVSFNSDSTQIYFQPQQSTTYTVSGSVSALCPYPRQISFTITVQDDPMPVFSDTVLCVGETFAIALDTSYQFQFQPSAQVVYTPGADSAHFPSSALTYTVSATRHGCPVRNQTQFTVQILPDPVAAFTINPAYAPIELPVFQLINQSNGASSFAWFQGNNWLDTTWNYTYTAADTGWYCFRLIAYNSLHCADSITHCAEVLPGSALFIPNAFSPNADGVNDVFNIVAKNITLLSFRIYNRWGQELFNTSDINKGWDGKYKGVDCELGVYFYIAEYSDRAGKGYMKKGDLSLIR